MLPLIGCCVKRHAAWRTAANARHSTAAHNTAHTNAQNLARTHRKHSSQMHLPSLGTPPLFCSIGGNQQPPPQTRRNPGRPRFLPQKAAKSSLLPCIIRRSLHLSSSFPRSHHLFPRTRRATPLRPPSAMAAAAMKILAVLAFCVGLVLGECAGRPLARGIDGVASPHPLHSDSLLLSAAAVAVFSAPGQGIPSAQECINRANSIGENSLLQSLASCTSIPPSAACCSAVRVSAADYCQIRRSQRPPPRKTWRPDPARCCVPCPCLCRPMLCWASLDLVSWLDVSVCTLTVRAAG